MASLKTGKHTITSKTLRASGQSCHNTATVPYRLKNLQLGSEKLENTFTDLQGTYAVGQWQCIQATSIAVPYLIYHAVEDHRTRPKHHQQWNGSRPTIFRTAGITSAA